MTQMNTHVYIIRHAEVVYSYNEKQERLMYRPEVHISDEGREQITKFARQLKNCGIVFDKIETSPFTRAIESARIVSDIMGLQEPSMNGAFSDSYVPGWFDVPLNEQQKLMDRGEDIYLNPRSDDQEKYDDIANRMFMGFKDLVERNKGKTIAMISHGDPIRLLLYRLECSEGKIPNMSVLSKQEYLKRGEAFHIIVDDKGDILKSELVVGREGISGKREIYKDN